MEKDADTVIGNLSSMEIKHIGSVEHRQECLSYYMLNDKAD